MIPTELHRDFVFLKENNKFKKKAALQRIVTSTTQQLDSTEFPQQSGQQLCEELLPHLVPCLFDETESVRETVLHLFQRMTTYTPNLDPLMNALLPALHKRLGQPELVDPSEEIRLLAMQLYLAILLKGGQHNQHFADEHIAILKLSLVDAFAEVKKVACGGVQALAQQHGAIVYHKGEALLKPLLSCLAHPHWRVRKESVQAAESFFLHCHGKHVEEFMPHLAQRLFDPSPTVRQAVIAAVGHWLLDLPDRYSYFPKFLPLLLTGYNDDSAEIRELAGDLWHDVGLKFEKENENDLKDKMDFGTPCPSHYPEGVDRPNLGCRTLVYRNLSKILPAINNDLCDWLEETRTKAAQLLVPLLISAEDCATQHADVIVVLIARGMADDCSAVRRSLQRAAQIMSHFMEPRIWWNVLHKNMKLCEMSSQQLAAHLACLTCLISGAQPNLLWGSGVMADIVSVALIEENVAQSLASGVKCHTLECVRAILANWEAGRGAQDEVLHTQALAQQRYLFYVIVCLMGVHDARQDAQLTEAMQTAGREVMLRLSQLSQLDNVDCLFRQHMPSLLQHLAKACDSWMVQSGDRLVFDSLLLESGAVLGECLEDALAVLSQCLQVHREPEFRLKFFLLLARLFVRVKETLNSQGVFDSQMERIVRDILLPNCIWKAGRTAEAVRKIAATCLWTMLANTDPRLGCAEDDPKEKAVEGVEPEILASDPLPAFSGECLQEMVCRLQTLLDDDLKDTRKLACLCLENVLQRCDSMRHKFDERALHNAYPGFLKRMDDAEDDIRVQVTRVWLAWFHLLRDDFDPSQFRAHLEEINRGLLIHLDDSNKEVQQAVYTVLLASGQLDSASLRAELQLARTKHRTAYYCDQLEKALI